jgi:nucleoside-diphosphate-sugar epimerase
MRALVTGATGLIGSHLVEALTRRGIHVRALVRRTSNLRDIQAAEPELFYGDITDPSSLRAAAAGVDWVFHTAARMTDWGEWRLFYEANVQSAANLVDACANAGVKRLIHTSSTGVTGLAALSNVDESAPYCGIGNYEMSKVESEKLVIQRSRDRDLPVTVIRPCWTLGPRASRHVPLLIQYITEQKMVVIGRGDNPLSFVDPRDVAEAMILAASSPRAVGQIYHVTNGCATDTQMTLYRTVAELLSVPAPKRHVPFSVAYALGWAAERFATLTHWKDAPMLTPVRVAFLGRKRHLSCEKAMRELGYTPKFTLRESLRDAVAWYRHRVEVDAEVPQRVLAAR